MGILVRDHIRDSSLLRMCGRALVQQQGCFTECDRAQIFHRPGSEVGDGDEVQFVARIGDAVVVGEKIERVHGDFLTERGQVLFAGHGPEADRGLPGHGGSCGVEFPDDESHEIRGHLHGFREAQHSLPALLSIVHDPGIRDGGQCGIDCQGDGEDGFELRFIPTGEGPPRIGRLKLGRGQTVRMALFILVAAAIEPAQFIVQCAAKRQAQFPGAGLNDRREGDVASLVLLVHPYGPGARRRPFTGQCRCRDLQFGRIQENLSSRFGHRQRHDLVAAERVCLEVRLDTQVVMRREDMARESVGIVSRHR